ncbi:MAG: proprotein convertase P-domain-containing protein, partial [Alphaproteobacteria bacterium]|nr:proprotein convertase P-domain-containing protein [Alphaproteobacteria bacterium]
SGAVAVILEANPDLGWRDVQEILALSAQHNDAAGGSWQYNDAGNWNGGGMHFSHDYGFGALDLHAAVRLAETWTLQQTSANMTTVPNASSSPSLAIPATGTITTTMNIATDIEIEHVLVYLDISHTRAGDLVVTLVAPDGTESVLINRPENGNFTGIYGISGIMFETMSNAHWGESSQGVWTLRIQDTTGGNSGTLNSWRLGFTGNAQSADDLYVYTDDYAGFVGGAHAARRTLTDSSGTDSINLSTVTTATTLNMNAGSNSTIAGNMLSIAAGTTIENAYLGDGNDHVTGNTANNIIWGGRGDDTVAGSAGSDTLDGGAGSDTLSYLEAIANFTFNFLTATTLEVVHAVGAAWTDSVANFENFSFSDGTYTRAELEAYVNNDDDDDDDDDGVGGPGEVITGTGGNDVLYGTPGMDTINGGDGDDTIYGDDSADMLYGDNGHDYIRGDGGDDMIYGGAGNDTMLGGAGDDTIDGGTGNNIISGGDGTDTLVYSTSSTNFIIYRDNQNFFKIQDTTGAFGTAHVYNDIEFIQFSDQTVNLSVTTFAMNDTAWGASDVINGTAGNDTMTGTAGADTIYGLAGNDHVRAGHGDDIIYGGLGDDTLLGEGGDDVMYSSTGNDIFSGGDGNDSVIFETNSTGFVIYRTDSKYLTMQDSNNVYGTVRLYSDVEILQFDDMTITLSTLNLTIGGVSWGTPAAINGTNAANTINGTNAHDIIYGLGGNDHIRGGVGDDTLYGGDGNDTLVGEAGNDTLIGGAGADILGGSAGNDVFGFVTLGDGVDRVADFAAGDRLNITDILSGFTPGVDDINQFVSITRNGTKSTFSVDVDGGANNFVQAFTVDKNPFTGMTAQDLVNSGVLIVDQTLL